MVFWRRNYPFVFALVFFALLLAPLRNLDFSPAGISDNFYGRDRLVGWYNDFRLWLGDRVFPKVLVGEHGWMFYTAELSMDDYQNAIPLKNDKAPIVVYLNRLNRYLARQGIQLIVVIAPNKSTIYPEEMPGQIPVLRKQSRLDEVLGYMISTGNKTPIIDLRPALLAAKKDRQVYYQTDTHWNDYGALIAYDAIMERVREKFPQVQPHTLADFEPASLGKVQLDLSLNIGSLSRREEKISLTPRFDTRAEFKALALENGRQILFSQIPDDTLPRAVIYHDSFFFSVIPFLGEHFSRAVYIPHYSGDGIWDLKWITQEKPDVVIIEFAERYIHDIPRLVQELP